MKKFKEVFKVYKDKDGNFYREQNDNKEYQEIELAVVKPTHKHQQKAQEVYAKRWRDLVEKGAALRSELNDILRKRELWTDEMQKKEDSLIKDINDNERKVKKKGIRLSEAVELMKKNIKLKNELISLRFNRNMLDQNTAESLAEQARYDFMVSACTVYNENEKPFFNSFDDYLNQDQLGSVVPTVAGENFWKLTTDLDKDFRQDWEEYKFLQKYKVVDDKFRFVKNGKYYDIDGKLVDEFGRWVNEDGHLVDRDGNLVNELGQPIEDDGFFLDESGNPITEPTSE